LIIACFRIKYNIIIVAILKTSSDCVQIRKKWNFFSLRNVLFVHTPDGSNCRIQCVSIRSSCGLVWFGRYYSLQLCWWLLRPICR